MSAKTIAVTGGFSDAVFQSQRIFKSVMDAMARPGTVQTMDESIRPPKPLSAATGGILLALCDHDTPIWMSAPLAQTPVPSWIGFHTGAPIAGSRAEARFAIIKQGCGICSFDLFSQGTQEYPDRSTTLLIEVEDFERGSDWLLTGPGIRDSHSIGVAGLPDIFLRLWSENRAIFPRGVDVILTCANRFLCLPRTVRIEAREE